MAIQEKEGIAITGCGWVTPAAMGMVPEVLTALRSVSSRGMGENDYWAVPDSFRERLLLQSPELLAEKNAWMTALALQLACEQASLQLGEFPAERIGLLLGCALAGQSGMIGFAGEVRAQSPRFVSPLHFPQTVGNHVAGAISRHCNIRGPNLTLASGCISGLDAMVEACGLLKAGSADLLIAGGVDTLSPNLARGWAQPGMIPSESACLFIMERRRDARARGAAILATFAPSDLLDGDAASDAIVSWVTRPRRNPNRFPSPRSIVIENWTGFCFAALGPAAVAAALGLHQGLRVPLADDSHAQWGGDDSGVASSIVMESNAAIGIAGSLHSDSLTLSILIA